VSLLLSRRAPMQMKRRGVEMCIVPEGGYTPNGVDLPLLKAVAHAPQVGRRLGIRQSTVRRRARKTGRNQRSLGAASDSARASLAANHLGDRRGAPPSRADLGGCSPGPCTRKSPAHACFSAHRKRNALAGEFVRQSFVSRTRLICDSYRNRTPSPN